LDEMAQTGYGPISLKGVLTTNSRQRQQQRTTAMRAAPYGSDQVMVPQAGLLVKVVGWPLWQ